MQLRKIVTSAVLAAGCATFANAAQASITFEFDFGANTGTGFWDATLGSSRQAALNSAAQMFSTMWSSHFTNSGTIEISVSSTNDHTNTLASAGSYQLFSDTNGFSIANVVQTKLLGGGDLNGSSADGTLDINFGHAWQLNSSAPVADGFNGQYDFYSVIEHEFTHLLDFEASLSEDGTSLYGYGNGKQWTTFDSFLTNKNGTKIINADYSVNKSAWNSASVGSGTAGGGTYFAGAHAVAANGGQLVALNSPSSFNAGSSISHLDPNESAFDGMMMEPSVSTGPAARNYSAVEIGIMQDLGYTAVAAVPEPESCVMMICGLVLLGSIARRQQLAESTLRS